MDRRLLEIGEIHRDLREAAHQKAGTLYEAHASAGKAYGLGDLFRDIDVRGVKEDVVGNQKLARSYHGCASGGVNPRFAKIRPPNGISANFSTNPFELSAANVLKPLPFRRPGRGFVKVYGNLIALPDLLPNMVRHRDTVFDGDTIDRDEGHHVRGSHARMGA